MLKALLFFFAVAHGQKAGKGKAGKANQPNEVDPNVAISSPSGISTPSIPSSGPGSRQTFQGNPPRAVEVQTQNVLNVLDSYNAPPLENTTYEVGRNLPSIATAALALSTRIEAVGRVEHRIIPGPGGQLLLRLYYPYRYNITTHPVLLYFHGGGFVIANLDTYDASCRALTNAANIIVISVAYRQAPEHPFPAAVDDAYAAYLWTLQNAASFGGIPTKIAIGGESAGGNLAAVTTITARDRKIQLPVMQLLIYPVTDFANNSYASYTQFANAKPLNTPMLGWFGKYYLSRPTDKNDYRASPLLANLAGVPPAFFVIADIDPLRDQVQAFQQKLDQTGVPTAGKLYYGVTHEFFGLSGVSDTARMAVSDAAAALNQAFA